MLQKPGRNITHPGNSVLRLGSVACGAALQSRRDVRGGFEVDASDRRATPAVAQQRDVSIRAGNLANPKRDARGRHHCGCST
jgi:hypothetical protein